MTDRELLELAAKAAGYEYAKNGGYIVVDGIPGNWNPLSDDGDALRLAVYLFRDIHFWYFDNSVSVGNEQRVVCGDDPCAATRLAIVRAAAEVGRGYAMTPTETAAILRQFNDWRRGDDDIPQLDGHKVGEAIDAAIEMIDRLEAAESDALEQARLNGAGSEREAALMAKLEAAEKDIALKERIIDSLGSTLNAVANERDALRAKIEEMGQQKPSAWMLNCQTLGGDTGWMLSWTQSGAGMCNRLRGEENERKLYLAPGAKGE